MRGINKAILVGNLGKDPETRYTGDGKAVTSFSVATSESWKGRDGSQQEKTEWHNCVTFGRLAEIAGEYLRKGSKVYIEGKIQTDSYEKDGQKRYSTKINVRELQMLDSRGTNQPAGQGQPIAQAAGGQPVFDADIPF